MQRRSRKLFAAGLIALASIAAQAEVEGKAPRVRIGTSGDYPPFSEVVPETEGDEPRYRGFDITLAEAWAEARGVEIEWVRFRWPELVAALTAGRFDVAMSGVTVRPERSAAGRYTIATAETAALALVPKPQHRRTLHALDRPGVRIGVNAGGHLERVARARFEHVTLVAIPNNASVIEALQAGQVDAVITETHEARLWQASLPGSETLGPLSRDRKAWLVRADRGDLAADFDAWLLDREADGQLAAWRTEFLGASAVATAVPLRALLAAVDERLSLMPIIGAAKRQAGIPLEVPEREQVVLDAATRAVLEAAAERGVAAPDTPAVQGFFRAQMEAAKEVQWETVKDFQNAPEPPFPDLDTALRPGLLRIGERLARLLTRLPQAPQPAAVRRVAEEELRAPRLSGSARRALADAIAELGPAGE